MANPRSERPSYWAVIWGDRDRDMHHEGIPTSGPAIGPAQLRLTHTKCTDAYTACKQCFGTVAANMWVKDLGTTIQPLRINKRRAELLDRDKGTWIRVGSGSYLHKSDPDTMKPVFWVNGRIKP